MRTDRVLDPAMQRDTVEEGEITELHKGAKPC